jgi:hypothetical protein
MRTETTPPLVLGLAEPETLSDVVDASFKAINGIDAGLGRGRLLAAPTISTGTGASYAFLGRDLIPAGWRQARGEIDPTGANNGLIWEAVQPGDSSDDALWPRTITYDTAKTLVFTPLQIGVIVALVAGVAVDLSVSGKTCTITFIAGTTTKAEVLSLLAGTLAGMTAAQILAATAASLLFTCTGTTGTLPSTFEGGTVSLSPAVLVQYVQAGSTAVSWSTTTRIVTVGLDIAGGGDSVANILSALAASASGAQYVVQTRNSHTSTGAGDVTTAKCASLTGGAGKAMRKAYLLMAQGSNKDLLLTTRECGSDARQVEIALVDVTAADPPTVSVDADTGGSVIIRINEKAATTTAAQILQALRDSTAAMRWISVRLAPGSSGAGCPAAFAATALTDGYDAAGVECSAGTLAATGITALSDDGFTATIGALGATMPAGSTVAVLLRVGNALHQISAAVVA